MKALYYSDLGKVELKEVDKPTVQKDTDVILKVTLASICGSDMHLIRGIIPSTPGYILGHEFVGVIEEAGKAVTKFKPGDRVICPPVPYCGHCDNCQKGYLEYCRNGGIFGAGIEKGGLAGGHAEYIKIPNADSCLLHVPEGLEDEDVIFITDILTTGYAGVVNGKVKPGDNVVIFGAGPVGLAAVAAANLFSPKNIILVGRQDKFRVAMGRELGATHTMLSSEEDVLASISKIVGAEGVHVAIDAAGSEESIQQAMLCVGVHGNVSLLGIAGSAISIPYPAMFFKNVSINMGLAELNHMSELMGFVETKQIDLKPLITHRMRLEEAEKAIELFQNKKENVIKIVLKP